MEPKAYSYIRFSRPEQEKGDSIKRQTALSEEYAQKHGLVLDDTLKLTDRGLSAYNGYHRSKGALGEFLKLVEGGKIARGSILIVENMDRLSREKVLDALNQFTSIIRAGIKLVTLHDGMEYDMQSIDNNWSQLIISITYMARAHEESKAKSLRLSSAWKGKREKARNGENKLTAKCPAWLKPQCQTQPSGGQVITGYEVIPEVAQVINQIYDMKLKGKGSERITKELNNSNVWKPNGRKGKPAGWRKSFIDKLLHNDRRLIGEQQFYTMQKDDQGKRKRIPDGEPISNYFPPIIDKEKFDRVQAQINQNRESRGMGAGRRDKVSNLFTYLAVCWNCGSPMSFVDKGPKPKGGKYLQCNRARRGLGCTPKTVPYDITEEAILTYCKELDIADIMVESEQKLEKLAELQGRQQAIEGELEEIQKWMGGIIKSIENGTKQDFLRALEHRYAAHNLKKDKLIKEKQNIQIEIDKLSNNERETEQRIKDAQELIYKMKNMKEDKRTELRLNLRNQLKKIIRDIRIVQDPENKDNEMAVILFHSGRSRAICLREGKTMPHGGKTWDALHRSKKAANPMKKKE